MRLSQRLMKFILFKCGVVKNNCILTPEWVDKHIKIYIENKGD